MRDILDLIIPGASPQKKYGQIVKPLPGNRYQIVDSQQRIGVADAAEEWLPGDNVSISDGRIIGRAKRQIKPKTFEV